MADPGLTGERHNFFSDCDANTFSLMRCKWRFGWAEERAGNAAALVHQAWFSIAIYVFATFHGCARKCSCVRTVSLHL